MTAADRASRGEPSDATPSLGSLDGRAPDGTPLYVHLPFCAAKCHYCDFFSVPAEGHDRDRMIAAIVREAEARAPRHPRTVYFGGGTPSLLSCEELARLLEALQRITGFRESAIEVTAECNPESVDRDKVRALRDLGVKRISIGVQSLHDDVLRLFGRVHTAERGLAAFEDARAAGADDVNVDLIYAVPGQDLAQWERDLARVLALEPDHVSAYNLAFEEDTVFLRWLERGVLEKQSEESELAFFETTRAILAAHGYEAYEISNFARPGRRCVHNVNYWKNGAYLGVGPSAVSKLGLSRAGNVRGIAAYEERIEAKGGARDWSESPSAIERLGETWWLGLRLAEGVDAREARTIAGFDHANDPTEPIVERFLRSGHLVSSGARVRLSERGLPLADHVAKEFLALASVEPDSTTAARDSRPAHARSAERT